jgi:hypothetical protein
LPDKNAAVLRISIFRRKIQMAKNYENENKNKAANRTSAKNEMNSQNCGKDSADKNYSTESKNCYSSESDKNEYSSRR